jgi:PAS domain S-box-containing protein
MIPARKELRFPLRIQDKAKLEGRRQTILLFRWLIVLTSLLLMIYSGKNVGLTNPGYLLTAFFILSNLGLMFMPKQLFEHTKFVIAVLGVDVVLVSLVIYTAGGAALDLYLLYLLIIIAALPTRTMSVSIVVAFVACVFHATMIYGIHGREALFQASFLIKIPFLFAVAMFGSLISRQRAQLIGQREKNRNLNEELKRKLVKAKESREKLYEDVLMLYDYNHSILNSLDCGVMVMDLDGTITAFNRAAGEITGLRPDDVLFGQAGMIATLEGFTNLMNKSLEKPIRRAVVPLETPARLRKVIGISTYLLKHKKGKVGGVIAIFADLTEDSDIKEISSFSIDNERSLESLSINELIDEVVDATIMKAEECRATIEWCPRYALPDVSADARHMKGILSSAILNSLQMVGDGGRIGVSTARTEKGIITEVVGDGPEIPSEIHTQVFYPFANPIEDELDEECGYRDIPEAEDQIDFDTMVAAGDTAEDGASTSESTAEAPRDPSDKKRGVTILVADNDNSVRTFYKVILEKAGHNVLLAQDGGEAIRQAVSGGVDLLVLELRMPRVDGMQVIEHIGRTNPGLKIVVCTGFAAMQSECLGHENVVAYLTKPVSIFEFQKTIEGVLKQEPAEEMALASSACPQETE